MRDSTQAANASNQGSAALPLGIAIGAAVGVILGGVTRDWGVWLPIGIGVGTALGIALAEAGRSKGP